MHNRLASSALIITVGRNSSPSAWRCCHFHDDEVNLRSCCLTLSLRHFFVRHCHETDEHTSVAKRASEWFPEFGRKMQKCTRPNCSAQEPCVVSRSDRNNSLSRDSRPYRAAGFVTWVGIDRNSRGRRFQRARRVIFVFLSFLFKSQSVRW